MRPRSFFANPTASARACGSLMLWVMLAACARPAPAARVPERSSSERAATAAASNVSEAELPEPVTDPRAIPIAPEQNNPQAPPPADAPP